MGKWIAANHNKGYFALDITSVSSYSEFIDYIRWGYNRDGEDLPHVNLLMMTSKESHLPIYYRILSGSIKDVSTIDESLANLKLLGSRSVHLVMDKGFFSEANINALYNSHYRFSVGIPFTASIATNAVEENRTGMDSHKNFISIGEDDLYAALCNQNAFYLTVQFFSNFRIVSISSSSSCAISSGLFPLACFF